MKILKIILLEAIIYALFTAVIIIENNLISLLLIATSYGVFVVLNKKNKELLTNIKNLISNNQTTAFVISFILLLTFPIFLAKNAYWIQVVIMAGLYVIMALGLNIMVGNAGLICLGYAAFFAIGAYTYAIFSVKMGFSFWLCLPFAALVVMLFGLLLGLPALRVKGHYLALVTIAFGLVVYQLTVNLEFLTGGANGFMNIPAPSLGSYSFNSPINLGFIKLPFHANYYYLVLIFVFLTIVTIRGLSNSLTGLIWNAMREDQLAAQCYGVDLTRNKLWAFAFGAIFGGIAGAVYASLVGFIAPENFTYSHSILILSMILLGGIDSIPGVIFGAVVLTLIPEKFRAFADYRMMFYGVIVVLILLFKNEGLIPAYSRKFTSKWGNHMKNDKALQFNSID